MMRRKGIIVSVLLAILVTSFVQIPASGGTAHTVHLDDKQFSPAQITIKVGDTVEWINDESITHEVTIQGVTGGDSPDLFLNDNWDFTFDTVGTYKYRCVYHSPNFDTGMVGKVIVEAETDPPKADSPSEDSMEGYLWLALGAVIIAIVATALLLALRGRRKG